MLYFCTAVCVLYLL
ncbi:DUF1378 domain-containing protein, partial [Escherichia coli]